MSDPIRVPPAVESLIRGLVRGTGDEERDQRTSTFARGVALGALVGAAIAGSTIWQRRQARSTAGARPAPTPTGDAGQAPHTADPSSTR